MLALASLSCISVFAEENELIINDVPWPTEGKAILPNDSYRNVTNSDYINEKYNQQIENFVKLYYGDCSKNNSIPVYAYWMVSNDNVNFTRVYDTSIDDFNNVREDDTFKRISGDKYYYYKIRIEINESDLDEDIADRIFEGTIKPKAYFDYDGCKDDTANDSLSVKLYERDVDTGIIRLDVLFDSLLTKVYAKDCTSNGASDGEIVIDKSLTPKVTVKNSTGNIIPGTLLASIPADDYTVTAVNNVNDTINLGVSEPDAISATASDLNFGSVKCGFSPTQKALEVKNTSSDKIVVTNVSTASDYFTSDFEEGKTITIEPGETVSVANITPSSTLRGASFEEEITVDYQNEDGSEKSTLSAKAKIKVEHISNPKQGGWCECSDCDEYNKDFVGKIITGAGADQKHARTYYINFWPSFRVNLMSKHLSSVTIDSKPLVLGTDYTTPADDLGYTKVTVQNSYIRKLQPGYHSIVFTFKDSDGNSHSASGWFRLSSATGVYTGDDTDMFKTACALLGISFTGIWTILFVSLRKRLKNK